MVKPSDLHTSFQLGFYEKGVLDSLHGNHALTDDQVCAMCLHSMNKLLSNVRSCTPQQRESIFGLKNTLLLALRRNRPDVIRGLWLERTPGREAACRSCVGGMSSLSHVCTACGGTGRFKQPDSLTTAIGLVCGEAFEWRLPCDLARRLFPDEMLLLDRDGFHRHYGGRLAHVPRATGLIEEEAQFLLWVLQGTKLCLE